MPIVGEPIAKAVVTIDLDDKDYKKGMVTAEKDLRKFSDNAQEHAKKIGMVMMGIGAATAVGVGAAVVKFASFEKSMKNVASVSGATAAEFKTLSDFALKMGSDTAFSAKEAAEGMYFLASAGQSVAEQMQTTAAVLDLASATQSDLANSAQVVVNSLSGFQLEADQSRRVADVFSESISTSQATLSKLSVSIPITSASFEDMGYSIEQNVAALSLLYNRGGRAETAATGLRNAITRLIDPTKEAADEIARMGLDIDDLNPTANDLVDIIRRLEDANFDTASSIKIFGMENSAMIKLVAAGAAEFEKYEKSMSEAGGTAERMSKEQLDSLSGSMTQLGSSVDTLVIKLGAELAPAVRSVADFTKDLVTGFDKLGDTSKSIVSWGAAVSGGLLLVGGAGTILLSQLPKLLEGWTLVAPAMARAAPSMAMIGQYALLSAEIVVLYKALGKGYSAWKKWREGILTAEEVAEGWRHSIKGQVEAAALLTKELENQRMIGLDPATASIKDLSISTEKLHKMTGIYFKETANAQEVLKGLAGQINISKKKTGEYIPKVVDLTGAWKDFIAIVDSGLVTLGENYAELSRQKDIADLLPNAWNALGAAMESAFHDVEIAMRLSHDQLATLQMLYVEGQRESQKQITKDAIKEGQNRTDAFLAELHREMDGRETQRQRVNTFIIGGTNFLKGLMRQHFDWRILAEQENANSIVAIVQAALAEIGKARERALLQEIAQRESFADFERRSLAESRQRHQEFMTWRAHNLHDPAAEIALVEYQFEEMEKLYSEFGANTIELERWRNEQIREIRLAQIDHYADSLDRQLNAFSDFANAHSRLYGTWLGDLFGMEEEFHETSLSRFGNWVDEQLELLDALRDGYDSLIDTIDMVTDIYNRLSGSGGGGGDVGALANLANSGSGGTNAAGLGNLGQLAGIGAGGGAAAGGAAEGGGILGSIGSGIGSGASAIGGLPWGSIGGAAASFSALAMQAAIFAWMGKGIYDMFTGNNRREYPGESDRQRRERMAEIRAYNPTTDASRASANALAMRESDRRQQEQSDALRYADDPTRLQFLANQGNMYARNQLNAIGGSTMTSRGLNRSSTLFNETDGDQAVGYLAQIAQNTSGSNTSIDRTQLAEALWEILAPTGRSRGYI